MEGVVKPGLTNGVMVLTILVDGGPVMDDDERDMVCPSMITVGCLAG